MKLFLLTLCLLTLSAAYAQQKYSRVKIFTDSKGLQTLAELGVAVDHGTSKKDVFFISDFSESEIEKITSNGFSIEILIDDVKKYYVERNTVKEKSLEKNIACAPGTNGSSSFVPTVPANFNLGSMGGFFTYQEFLDEVDAMVAQYPSLITARAPISAFLTTEGRPLYWMRISDNPSIDETNETEILYSAIHHAREPNALSETIFYMWYLLENYATSEEIKFLLNNTEMYFVPCLNPDGYVYNETTDPNGGGMHRKNRRNVGTTNKGVDLNRNYSYGWGTTGVSFSFNDDTYPGTSAFSEAETQAMKWFCDQRDFLFAFNAHTYSDILLFPIGATTAEFAADNDYFLAFTGHMVQYNGYSNFKSSSLYPASGDSDDFMYKEDLINKPQIFAMTPEVGSSSQGFWPASTDITGICQDMVFPNLILSHLSHKYVVVKDLDATTIETLTGDFHYSIYRLGNESGAVTISVEPLVNIQTVGASNVHSLNLMETQSGAISFVLNSSIVFGDIIRYVIHTDYGSWVKYDTIEKSFGSITLQFFDDATTTSGWTGTWSTTNTLFYSPSKSFTDSPGGNYSNNTNKSYKYNQVIDLHNVSSAMVSYYAQWDIENDFDFCQFQVSTDGGINWSAQCGLYTNAGSGSGAGGVQPLDEPVYDGTQSTWVREEINLSDYIGQTINVRFLLKSDGGLTKDGFYFDDFQVMFNPISSANLQELTMECKVMPNPANLYTQVSLSSVLKTGDIKIIDQSGKVVLTQMISQPTNKITLDTERIPSGFYTILFTEVGINVKPVKLAIVH